MWTHTIFWVIPTIRGSLSRETLIHWQTAVSACACSRTHPGVQNRFKQYPTMIVYTPCGHTQFIGSFPPSEALFPGKPSLQEQPSYSNTYSATPCTFVISFYGRYICMRC